MTDPAQNYGPLAAALEDYLALPDEPEAPDPQLRELVHDLLVALKSPSPETAAPTRIVEHAGAEDNALQRRKLELRHELDTLAMLIRKNRDVAEQMEEQLDLDKLRSNEAWKSFDITRKLIARQGRMLLDSLSAARIERMAAKNREEILASPTTPALAQAMQSLVQHASAAFENAEKQDRQIKGLLEIVYARFSNLQGHAIPRPPLPNLDDYRKALSRLDSETQEFCRRPRNLMMDKHSLAKKFAADVAAPLCDLFAQLEAETDGWLKQATTPLQEQIQKQKTGMEKRTEDIDKIREHTETLETRSGEVAAALARLQQREAAIERVLTLAQTDPPANPAE